MLHSVAHATLSLRSIKVSREKSCNEEFLRGVNRFDSMRLARHVVERVALVAISILVAVRVQVLVHPAQQAARVP